MAEITKPIVFAVEGIDEINFFEAFLKHCKVDNFEIKAVLGKDNFKTQLKTLVASSGFSNVTKLVLIRDADESSENTFVSLQNTLKELSLPVPKQEGEFNTLNNLACGIYIMPLFPEKGMIENLCLQSINDTNDNLCIDKFIECVDKKPSNIAKAKAQIYLSIQNPMVSSLGIGAKKGYWNFNHQCFDKLRHFVGQLIENDERN